MLGASRNLKALQHAALKKIKDELSGFSFSKLVFPVAVNADDFA